MQRGRMQREKSRRAVGLGGESAGAILLHAGRSQMHRSTAAKHCALVRRSGGFRNVVQDEQVRPRAGSDRVGATSIVAELHEQRLVIKLLDDSADLSACKPLRG